MFIQFDTPNGVQSEASRDRIVETLEAIAEQVAQGKSAGSIKNLNGDTIGRWMIAAPQVEGEPILHPIDATHLQEVARARHSRHR